MLSNNAPLSNEMKNLTLVYTLLVIYIFMLVPYVVRVKVDQIVQVCRFFSFQDKVNPRQKKS